MMLQETVPTGLRVSYFFYSAEDSSLAIASDPNYLLKDKVLDVLCKPQSIRNPLHPSRRSRKRSLQCSPAKKHDAVPGKKTRVFTRKPLSVDSTTSSSIKRRKFKRQPNQQQRQMKLSRKLTLVSPDHVDLTMSPDHKRSPRGAPILTLMPPDHVDLAMSPDHKQHAVCSHRF